MALAWDLIYADQTAEFGQPEGRLGFVTGWGASRRLPLRVSLARAKSLCFIGKPIDAKRAQQIGLPEVFENAERLDAAIAEFAKSVGESAPASVAESKQLRHPNGSANREACALQEVEPSVRCLRSDENQQRLRAFPEKQKR